MQPITEAFSIMLVGMITVILILLLIVVIGNLLIRLSNKYLPEEIIEANIKKTGEPSETTIAAILAAIDLVTKGRGKVTSIKKL